MGDRFTSQQEEQDAGKKEETSDRERRMGHVFPAYKRGNPSEGESNPETTKLQAKQPRDDQRGEKLEKWQPPRGGAFDRVTKQTEYHR